MGNRIDPRQVNYNGGEYGNDAQGNRYNRQGQETWESEYNRNRREAEQQRLENIRNDKESRANERRMREEEERRRRQSQPSASYRPVSSGSGLSIGGFLGGIGALFVGWMGMLVIVAILFAIAIFIGFIQYHSKGVINFFGNIFSVIGKIFTMPFTAWPTLFKSFWSSLFNPLEFIFAAGIIIYTVLRCRADRFFLDIPYIPAVIGLVLLEFIHHFFGPLGLIGSLYNGLCLFIPVYIILSIIDKINFSRT